MIKKTFEVTVNWARGGQSSVGGGDFGTALKRVAEARRTPHVKSVIIWGGIVDGYGCSQITYSKVYQPAVC